jgi:prepilin-type N-terminal cleavage/methylation domain-containing protein
VVRPRVARPESASPAAAEASAERGFSVIELMVALTVLGIGIIGLANVFPYGSQTQVKDRLRTSGADLAQQKMEQLRTVAWSDANLTDGTHPSNTGRTLTLSSEGNFNRLWFVTTQAGTFSDMKLVTVRVRWTYPRPDSVDLTTYFRR